MLDFCSNYAVMHPLHLIMKSYCIRFLLHDISVEQFTTLLQGARLIWFNKIEHLGHILLVSLHDSEDIICKQNDFRPTFQFNYFMSRFRNSSISLKNIYLRTFVIRFSAVSYGTYSIEIFCQHDILWRTAV